MPKSPETGFENSDENWCKLLPQSVAVTDSEITSRPLSESRLPKGSGVNKQEELKHPTHSIQTTPNPSENKEEFFSKSPETDV